MLMLAAKIVLEYSSGSVARGVMIALNPDNQLSKAQMRVETDVEGKRLRIRISRCPSLETMRSTLEDVFRCAKAAEGSMSLAERRKDKRIKKDKRFK
jgi:tRNA threonylcarbamoyladenosine modification (KEOPS) complex  Pcc1 subunit